MTFDGQLFSGITVLAAVAESRSFTRAADALGLSPSGVSKAMKRLEQRMGVRLIERTTRSLKLTDDGQRLYDEVGTHLVGIEDAAARASGSKDSVRGRLRVNVDPFFSRIALAPSLAGFLNRYPDLSLELIMRDDVGDLVADGFDLAIRFGQPPVGSFVGRRLDETRVLTVASPAYIEAHGRPEHPYDVERHQRILFYNAGAARAFEWQFCRADEVLEVRPAGHLLVSDVGTMLGACVAGAGIAQVLELGAEDLLRSGQLIELFPDWPDERFPLYALYPSRQHLPAKVRTFIDFCLANLVARRQ
ncbi:LysR family transcriptional regulator [Paraburkholderia sp. BL6665CI2N2]|uniref:LysR family transcriptional regulator n=1 Tax=Paraburkholderia sp. BL6665CI2N2 TaxID=1938806 RepID=UPI00106564B4|nr:LysR family transcriptional regulator [Paraburkholderia sp. BL6665CI2N2]TDY20530.1 LysR family transcriptional regulator [Paraburkholderia sp. BL6665CI2N2]